MIPPVVLGPVVLARADEPDGEVVLRRRGDHVELVVDGRFAMDTVDTSTERELATAALERFEVDATGLRVLVAGLGLGFTTAAVLADPRVERVEVVELSAAVAGWVRSGLVPATAGLAADPRLEIRIGDIRTALAGQPAGSFDVLLLDVDNGPGFLLHPGNAALYRAPFLRLALRSLRPGGVLAIWSAEPSPALRAALAQAAPQYQELARVVHRDGRVLDYALYLTDHRPDPPPA